MMQKIWAAWGFSGASLAASIAVATDILQFLTALLAFICAAWGFWLMVRKRKGSE